MSLIWVQSLIVGLLIYGIILLLYGVRTFQDFVRFSAALNRRRNRYLAVLYLILPRFLFAWLAEFVLAHLSFILHPVTLAAVGIVILLVIGIPFLKKLDIRLLWRRAGQRIREAVTPLQFFLWIFLFIIAVTLTWFLVGQFWFFNGFIITALFIVYIQLAGIYFFGSYFRRRYIENQTRQGNKFAGSGKFRIQQIHVFIFLALNYLTLGISWLIIGDFWIISRLTVLVATTLFVLMSLIWGFGSIVWKTYLLPMAESDSNARTIIRTIRSNLTDIIAGIVAGVAILLFFIFRPLIQDLMTARMKIWIGTGAAALIVLYLCVKYLLPRLSLLRGFVYLGFSLPPEDRAIMSEPALKARRFRLITAWLIFLGQSAAFSLAVWLLIDFREDILFRFSMNDERYYAAYNLLLSVLAGAFVINNLSRRLSGISYEVARKRYYINKKRKMLMLELEEIQKRIEKEKRIQEELRQFNIKTAIDVLKENGYQIIIGPETKSAEPTHK